MNSDDPTEHGPMERTKKREMLWRVSGTLLLSLILYVASFGPVYASVFYDMERSGNEMIFVRRVSWCNNFYYPIKWIQYRSEGFSTAADAYVEFSFRGLKALMERK